MTFIPLNTVTRKPEKNFLEMIQQTPCSGCSAPCCRMLLIPHKTPTTFLDIDYIRYMLGFRNVEMLIGNDGSWMVCLRETCQLLDQASNLCTVHNTDRKPQICVNFNPYQCWYKRNFDATAPVEAIRLDMNIFEIILPHITFDANGVIVQVPTWESLRTLIDNTSIGSETAAENGTRISNGG